MNAQKKIVKNLAKSKVNKKKEKFSDEFGLVNCFFGQNNTIINFSRPNGNVLFWCSSGKLGYKNTRKSTPYVAKKVAENIILQIQSTFGKKDIKLKLKDFGPGRNMVVKEFLKPLSFRIIEIIDFTPLRLGGGVLPKKRVRK